MESLLSHAVMLPILHVSVTDVRVYRAVIDIPGIRAVCHLTNRGFLTETAVFSSESFILTYTNAE